MNKIWFKRKIYGWGWYPATWEGLLVLGGYIILVIVLAANTNHLKNTGTVMSGFVFPFIVLTVLLIVIMYYTGEPPRWQWGRRKDGKDPKNQ